MSKSSKFFLGTLLGAAAGILLSPVSGKKAREKVKSKAKDYGIDLGKYSDKIESVLEKGGEILEKASSEKKSPTKRKK